MSNTNTFNAGDWRLCDKRWGGKVNDQDGNKGCPIFFPSDGGGTTISKCGTTALTAFKPNQKNDDDPNKIVVYVTMLPDTSKGESGRDLFSKLPNQMFCNFNSEFTGCRTMDIDVFKAKCAEAGVDVVVTESLIEQALGVNA